MLIPFDFWPVGGNHGFDSPYIRLPYVELSYRSVETDYVISNIEETVMEVDFTPLEVDSDISLWHTWYGAFSRAANSSFRLITKSSDVHQTLSATTGGVTGYTVMQSTPFGDRLLVKQGGNFIIINDEYQALGAEIARPANPIDVFRLNGYYETRNSENTIYSGGAARFYSIKCMERGIMKLDMVPVRRSDDGQEGFWCMIHNKFYY